MQNRGALLVCFLLIPCGWGQSFKPIPAKRPQAGTMFMVPERIALQKGGFVNAERGWAFVPLNRSKASSPVIAVEVYRFPRSTKADPNTPPVFYFPGGPGFAGLEKILERQGRFESRWRPFLDLSDLVIVSQRGIGPSKPSTIIETTMEPSPLDQPFDDAETASQYRQILAAEKAEWEKLGVDLSGFNVLEAAADVEDVRQGLGYDKIIVWGGSFGSHWGMTFMRHYPESVARAILFGMEGPDQSYDRPSDYWKVYQRVARAAEKSAQLGPKIPKGGLIKALQGMIRRANANPFKVTVNGSQGPTQVYFDGEVIINYVTSKRLEAWPACVIDLHHGDYEHAAKELLATFETRKSRRQFGTASFWMLDCGSGISPSRLAAYEVDPAREFTGHTYWSYAKGCGVWGSDLGDNFRQNFQSHIPTLMVQGTWDPYTPYENALELLPFFKNGHLVSVLGGPHGAIMAASRTDPAFKKALHRFAVTGDMSQMPETVAMPPANWVMPNHQ